MVFGATAIARRVCLWGREASLGAATEVDSRVCTSPTGFRRDLLDKSTFILHLSIIMIYQVLSFFFLSLEISAILSLARHPCMSLGQKKPHCSPKWDRLGRLAWVANHRHAAKGKTK